MTVSSLKVSMKCPQSPFRLASLAIGVNKSAISLTHFVCLSPKFVLKEGSFPS